MVATCNISEPSLSVAEIVLSFPHALAVLTRHNIDYCCRGKRSFKEACENAGLNADALWEEIVRDQPNGNTYSLRFSTWDTALLAEYIVQNHHQYVKEVVPQLQELLDKVCNVHGEDHIELAEIRDDFNDLAEELLSHIRQEEELLFPAIRKGYEHIQALNLEDSISTLETEHEHAGDLMKSIRQLTSQYTAPRGACPTFQLTYKKLEAFDQDLMQHLHLENNVLFEKLKNFK